jgi:hypothetical protein
VTVTLWAELFEKLVPVLSGISIALVAWLSGRNNARIQAQNDDLRETIKAREVMQELFEGERTDATRAQELADSAPALRSGELSDAEYRAVFGHDRVNR